MSVEATEAAAPGKFYRRDHLVEIEKKVQQKWKKLKAFDTDAPANGADAPRGDKFMVTFPYPYMNGRLHLGHGFSVTKAEFAARFQRLEGKKALFPFAFHCTGMPIVAAAGNLKRELEGGNEPDEPIAPAPDASTQLTEAELQQQRQAGGVFKGKKTKAKAKSGGLPQSQILKSMGIPDEEIPKFVDPNYWLEYFPPYGQTDLERFGLAIDWRRAFITTDKNPYYDAFIQWQFRRLRDLGKIKFGNRPAIFSARENQPCADHDRQSGEGVGPQEYTLIKLRVKTVPEKWASSIPGDQKIFLVAATLRPETMYGQTNCFVLPEGEYGLYQMHNNEVFVCSRRSATNMIFQNLGPRISSDEAGGAGDEPVELLTVPGTDLVGLPLLAPFAEYDTVYALPMFTISMSKGTGIVTSVPADSPDDYVCLRDWKTRKNWRDQYGIKDEWVLPFEVVPVIEIPDSELGNASAVYACENLFKIDSHKSKDKLEEPKKLCYMKGFYNGILIKGEFAGKSVQEAKKLVKDRMIELGLACNYYEPESLVTSRSGDECVVALCDQWYITYGEPEWLAKVENHIKSSNFEMYNPSALQLQIASVQWFKDWACSRTFGLGSHLPWDKNWLIESLSDSTVYMAYYSVAHFLQGGDIQGSKTGPLGITPDMISDDDWNYMFAIADTVSPSSKIGKEKLDIMRNEFLFWYPMDLRVSGKDLITNHLTMSLYNHAAIWENRPDLWPRAFFTNGMVEIDDQKMSKSLGNFLTLQDACDEYGADATRLALADAGDDLTKANFRRKTANDNILALTTLENWIAEFTAPSANLRAGDFTFVDRAFDNEINRLLAEAEAAFKRMSFREALKNVWFEMLNMKEQYRVLTEGSSGGMHALLVRKFAESIAVAMSPITPHFCEHIWSDVLGKEGLVMDANWPQFPVDLGLSRKYQALQANLREFRLDFMRATGSKKPGRGGNAPIENPTDAIIFCAEGYAPYQRAALIALSQVELDSENEPVDKKYMATVKDHPEMLALSKPDLQKALKFAPFHMANDVKANGRQALELSLPYNEIEMLSEQVGLIAKQLGLSGSVEVMSASSDCPLDTLKPSKREQATPGKATILFYKK